MGRPLSGAPLNNPLDCLAAMQGIASTVYETVGGYLIP
ncbi:hypothetical protein STRCR_0814 [Streptococcus criceti HS-6]|uniref:Uncharacterized protein n=1 Tax=Streptococcus criceti HS-6 TaxID=873449 RepID=G5JRV6_STRCG|nr:hypothetical protein STRCR_0814 [Streptococcus criceti HS-6]